MVTPELHTYIENQLLARTSREKIVETLIAQGWLPQDIMEAMAKFPEESHTHPMRPVVPPSPHTQPSTSSTQSPESAYTIQAQNQTSSQAPVTPQYPTSQPAGELMSIENHIKQSFRILEAQQKPLLFSFIISFLATLIPIIFSFILMGSFQNAFGISSLGSKGMSMTNPQPESNPTSLFILIASMIPMYGTMVFASIVQYFNQYVQLFIISGHKERIGLKLAAQKALPNILPALGIGILSGLLTFGGFTFFIIPGVIVSYWFIFSQYALAVDNKHGFAALLYSKHVGKNYLVAIFIRFLILGLLLLIPFGVIGGGGLVVSMLVMSVAPMAGSAINSLLSTTLQTCGNIIYIAFTYALYTDLKRLKPTQPESEQSMWKYWALGILGFVGPTLIFLGYVAAFALVAINPSRQIDLAHQTQTKTNLYSLQLATKSWAADHNGIYPNSLQQLTPNYIKDIPTDNDTNMPYLYTLNANGSDFQICDKPMGTCITRDGLQTPNPTPYLK